MEIVFLKIRKIYLYILFTIKKFIYNFENSEYKRKLNNSFFKMNLIELIKKIFINTVIVVVLLYIESKVDFLKFQEGQIDYELFSDLLIATVGIAGVFLGLYCSNMMSVFTSRYMNAPEILVGLFEKDILLNKCIRGISNFLILSILVLALNFLNMTPGILLISYCLVNAILIIISYSLSGRRSFQISDIFNIARPLYWDISKKIDDISKNKFFYKDINFQNHYKKTVHKNINYIEEIIEYAIETTNEKESVMKTFLHHNMYLIMKYWKIKKHIPYDSYWYDDKQVYSKWHRTDDTTIQISIRTGTSIPPQEEKDYYAIENSLNSLNKKCLSILYENNCFANLYKWIEDISKICECAIESNCLNVYLQYVSEIRQRVCNSININRFSDSENQALIDVFMCLYVTLILELRKHIDKIDIVSVLDKGLNMCSKNFDTTENIFLNHQDITKLHRCIMTEIKIESKRITPDWYIKQVIAKHIYDHLIKIYIIIDEILNSDIPELSEYFLKEKHYAETMLIYSRMTELRTKSREAICKIEKNINILKEYHLEKTIIWEDNPVLNFKEKQDLIFSSLPIKWISCSCHFSVEKYENTDQFPDYLGECYNRVCEFLITSLEKEDFESFSKAYRNFGSTAFLYQEVIRKDLLAIKEAHMQDSVCNVIANPIVEFANISGYAYLLGEMSDKDYWKDLIEKEFKLLLDKISNDDVSSAEICEKISINLNIKKFTRPAIYNRDVIHTEWKQRFERKMIGSDYLSWKNTSFRRECNNKSDLLKAIIGEPECGFILRYEAFEIFAIKVLNKYLDEGKQFKSSSGWEKRLNAV